MKEITRTTDIKIQNREEILAPGRALLFDIETTGLKKETTQIYLIGCGSFDETGTLTVRQWLAQSLHQEKEVTEAFLEFASGFDILVHFNGGRFDIPYTEYRAAYNGLEVPFGHMVSMDIYRELKPAKRLLGLERMNQKALERFMRIKREDKMGGGELIPVFYEYARFGSSDAERLLLLHNFCDICGMAELLPALSYGKIARGDFTFERVNENKNILELRYNLKTPVPYPVSVKKDTFALWADAVTLGIDLDIFEDEFAYALPDYKDYYYLPAEDMIIHKDVAQFVDKSRRQKATAKNCFVKKQGRFVKVPDADECEAFFRPSEGRGKSHYLEVTKISASNPNKFLQYAMDFFTCI